MGIYVCPVYIDNSVSDSAERATLTQIAADAFTFKNPGFALSNYKKTSVRLVRTIDVDGWRTLCAQKAGRARVTSAI